MSTTEQQTKPQTAPADATDWTEYYKAPFKATSITRNFTGKLLERYLSLGNAVPGGASIIEIGGANSCFYTRLRDAINPSVYTVIDLNNYGLDLFREQYKADIDAGKADAMQADVLDTQTLGDIPKADIVFSVGLIEHFDQTGTAESIRSHFMLCKPGGLVVMTFPTPTLLYRGTRGAAELMGKWIFHDERPLRFPEVLSTCDQHGKLIRSQINWPIFLTQGIVAYKVEGDFQTTKDPA
tara:strand:- start:226762 stop:227478 length:717 start_codon:yes stop_codon:yes gene_type:complete